MKKADSLVLKGHKKQGSILPELLLLLLLVSILFLMVFINDVVTYIGFKEVQANLADLNQENSKRDFLNMVSKYKLQKKLYENLIDDIHFTAEELKINSIINTKDSAKADTQVNPKVNRSLIKTTDIYEKLLSPALLFINSIRFTIGKKPLSLDMEDPAKRYLDIAYYYERNKLFKKALEIYDRAIGAIVKDSDRIPIIQLHQGFCFSIIGDYENAKKKYTIVITGNRNQEVTETARILLGYINDIQEEIIKIRNSGADDITKGEKLFKLMAYNEAIGLLDKVKPGNQEELEKTQYYKARSLEENGDVKKSVEIYQDIITQNPESEHAKQSNRRILSISTMNADNKPLRELADKNNQAIKDSEYSDMAKVFEQAAGESGKRSLEDVLKNSSFNGKITKDLLADDAAMEKNDFINDIVNTVVKGDKTYSVKNTAFYEQAIKKLEDVKRELEEKNTALEKNKQLIESRLKDLKKLEEKNAALEKDKRLIERQLKDLKKLEEKNTLLVKDKQLTESNLKNLDTTTPQPSAGKNTQTAVKITQNNTAGSDRLEEVSNADQFGRIISKYRYRYDASGNRNTDSYSIYYYQDSGDLYKVMDYNGENKLTAYYIILYDAQEKQVKIKKYDENNNLIYVK